MNNYYDDHLSAERLRRAYELAPSRVKQYLNAEISFIEDHLHPSDVILELGCGYGRVIRQIYARCRYIVGIDTSTASLKSALAHLNSLSNIAFVQMDATKLGFSDGTFDCVFCIQNGISAFHVDPHDLIRESLRVTRHSGRIFFSSYAAGFWEDRLEWFRIQAVNGLIGEIDWEKTRDGTIVCKDDFTATTFGPDDFAKLVSPLGLPYEIREVDGSSLFCTIDL
jgi:ubiquinone/menaquinone biosynthesis C-methylase UbiE